MTRRALCFALALVGASACAPSPPRASDPADFVLVAPDGEAWALAPHLRAFRFTVLVFFSADCPTQSAHDRRIVELAQQFRSRGVGVFAVDSEVTATPERDAAEARKRGYPFPILVDERAKLARALGAEYATYTVVVDPRGDVLYRGGFDSDRVALHERATLYVRDALDAVLAGRRPRVVEGEALGCALRTW